MFASSQARWRASRKARSIGVLLSSVLMAFAIDGAAAQAADSAVGKTGAAAVQIESRGVVLAVDDADVTLTRKGDGRPFFSYRAFEAERFQRDLALLRDGGAPDETKGCVRRIKVMPIAWAGVLLSVRQSSQTSCPREAHPADESRFVTFAVSAGGGQKNEDADALKAEAPAAVTPVSLTEWVGEQAVFAALRKDPLVRKALTDAAAPPTTLGVLLNLLIESPPVVGDKRHCYAFPDDLLRRFAPSHLQGGRLALRLSLSGTAVCRENLTEIGILVPLPRSLAAPLSEAGRGRLGFLKRNPPRRLASRPVLIELRD